MLYYLLINIILLHFKPLERCFRHQKEYSKEKGHGRGRDGGENNYMGFYQVSPQALTSFFAIAANEARKI